MMLLFKLLLPLWLPLFPVTAASPLALVSLQTTLAVDAVV